MQGKNRGTGRKTRYPSSGGGPRRRTRYLEPNAIVDINDVDFLRRFVTEFGKIVPARVTGVTARQQREIRRGVKRARNMGLLA
ncbi:MAG: 30S ribosomal protein S18 [Kiritimatiellia bacterium]